MREKAEAIDKSDLTGTPFEGVEELAGRAIVLMPYWDGECWHVWARVAGRMMDLHPHDAALVDYLAAVPAKETDLHIPFLNFVYQHASWPDVVPLIAALSADFHNLGTSVAKLRLVWDSRTMLEPVQTALCARTEVEYALIVCRSVFDLLQELVSSIWNERIALIDSQAEARRRKRRLPETFSKVVLDGKVRIRDTQELQDKFSLPGRVAEAYIASALVFQRIRDWRDRVVHGGSELGTIFVTERGFCVGANDRPYVHFAGWTPAHKYNATLVSLLPWLADVVLSTIGACGSIMLALESVIQFPSPIAPGQRVFVRGPTTHHLAALLSVARDGSVWWEDGTSSDS